jgi:hypothetical protein
MNYVFTGRVACFWISKVNRVISSQALQNYKKIQLKKY